MWSHTFKQIDLCHQSLLIDDFSTKFLKLTQYDGFHSIELLDISKSRDFMIFLRACRVYLKFLAVIKYCSLTTFAYQILFVATVVEKSLLLMLQDSNPLLISHQTSFEI